MGDAGRWTLDHRRSLTPWEEGKRGEREREKRAIQGHFQDPVEIF